MERSFFQQVLDVLEGFVADVDAVIEVAARLADYVVTLEPLRRGA